MTRVSLLSAAALGLLSCKPDVITVSGAPSIAFEQLEHDFGEVQAGAPLTHRFSFVNAGDQPLELGKPRGS